MAFNSLSGTIIGPDKIVAKPDGTFTQITGTISGSYINADGDAVSFSEIGTSDGGTIGEAEDGDYTDGLFQDFTTSTLIGVPIDRFNELFKSLVPPPAPNVSRIDATQEGTGAYLSFGASNNMEADLTPYYSVGTQAGFSAVDKGELYETEVSGNNFRRSIFQLDTNITGAINFDVAASVLGAETNYEADAFGNGETGSLQLFVNDTSTAIHTLDLSTATGTGNPGSGLSSSLNSDGSGFTNISISASATDANSNTFDIFQHRTAKYIVHSASQRRGWNYAFVRHTVGSANYDTNYIEWVNDDEPTDITITNNTINNVSLGGSRYISGIQYNTGSTAIYQFDIDNFYRNVYNLATVTCTDSTDNAVIESITMPHIGIQNESKGITRGAPLSTTDTIILNESIGATASVTHVLKGTVTGSTSISGFLIFTPSANNPTDTYEYFKDETYRLASGSYNSNGAVELGAWDEQTHMTGSGNHSDGLQIYNQKLVSPLKTTNGGDFSTIAYTESGNPDYSSASGTRTFYRKFQNTAALERDAKITIKGDATIVANTTTLGADKNIHVFIKVPNSSTGTGWMDLALAFDDATFDVTDNAGANELGLDATINSNGAVNYITVGTADIAQNDYFLIKIEADAEWTGNITEISVEFGAGTGTITNPQDVSRLDETMSNNGSPAALSFGDGDNTITGYTNATNIPAIRSEVGLNDTWSITSDTSDNQRLGVYLKDNDITAKINSVLASSRFTDGNEGDLKLYLNDDATPFHTVDLSSFTSGDSLDAANSRTGFTGITAVDYPTYSNGIHDYTKPFRTGSVVIDAEDQRNGWNWVKVVHSGTNIGVRESSYIEWINDGDSSGVNISITGGDLSDFDNNGTVHRASGISYFNANSSAPSASFTVTASNCYRNVYFYVNGGISFAADTLNMPNLTVNSLTASGTQITDSTVNSNRMTYPDLITSSSGVEQATIDITLNASFNLTTSLHGFFETGHTASVRRLTFVEPPSNGSSVTSIFRNTDFNSPEKSKFLVSSGDNQYTNEYDSENFGVETYRLVNKNQTYTNQTDVYNNGNYVNSWNSQNPVNDTANYPNYDDGLIIFGSKLVSPIRAGNNGDCRNVSDGGVLQAPAGNPNYSNSSLAVTERTYVRAFKNTTGSDKSNFVLTVYGSGTLDRLGSFANSSDFKIEYKYPDGASSVATGWLDAGRNFNNGNRQVDGEGGVTGTSFGYFPLTISTSGTQVGTNISLLGGSWENNGYLLIRITAEKGWDGYIDRIEVN